MVSLYEILTDKYGDYYLSYGKKHRIETLWKKNEKIWDKIQEIHKNGFFDDDYLEEQYNKQKIDFKLIILNGKKYIQFGG